MAKPRIGVIGIPGKWSTETLADAIEKRTSYRLVIDMSGVTLDLAERRLSYKGHDLCALDGLVVKKISASYSPNTVDRLELLRIAEQAGVRVFSGATNMLRLVNRLSCTVTLRNAGIPMPETVITERVADAIAAVDRYGSAVLKPLYSTKARGMTLIGPELSDQAKKSALLDFQSTNPLMYIQRKLDTPGQDLGLVFLGGDYLGCYARVASDSAWNTTIHSGGRYATHRPTQDIIDLAQRAQAPFAMDFTTVDVMESNDGPVVFEVSAFGGFRGALEGAGLDAASHYADYIYQRLEQ